jgi:hypothetical protein
MKHETMIGKIVTTEATGEALLTILDKVLAAGTLLVRNNNDIKPTETIAFFDHYLVDDGVNIFLIGCSQVNKIFK